VRVLAQPSSMPRDVDHGLQLAGHTWTDASGDDMGPLTRNCVSRVVQKVLLACREYASALPTDLTDKGDRSCPTFHNRAERGTHIPSLAFGVSKLNPTEPPQQ